MWKYPQVEAISLQLWLRRNYSRQTTRFIYFLPKKIIKNHTSAQTKIITVYHIKRCYNNSVARELIFSAYSCNSAIWLSYFHFYSINCIVNQNNGQIRNIFHSAIMDTHTENWDQLYLFEWAVNGVYAINIIQTLALCECCAVWETLKR